MISVPSGVADYLAPHPDWEIGPARSANSGPVLFSVLADRLDWAVVASCDEHETDDCEPGDREGNSDHGCCPFCLQGLAPKSFGRSARVPEWNTRIGRRPR